MIADKIRALAEQSIGIEIPKPVAKAPFRIKGIGKRRREEALTYLIPSHSPRTSHYIKGITLSEFEKAYSELISSKKLTRKWFNLELQDCAKEGACNFTTIGGIFQLLGLAKYKERGIYVHTPNA